MIKYDHKIYDNNILLDEITDILKSNGEVVLKTRGRSMQPFIRDSIDSVLLKSPFDIKVGDVVLANVGTQQRHHYVLHRIDAIDGDNVTLMGDGNCVGKEYCRMSDISGKVISIIRPSGRTFKVTSGRLWKFLLPIRPYLLYIYAKLPDWMK